MGKISIIIPTLNSSLTINKCIKSVLNQTYKNFEIIILDSYSKDNTLNKIRNLKSNKIKIFSISKKKKLSDIRYFGILKSKGEFICFLDSDDYWHKSKLEKQYSLIKKKNLIICSTNFSLIKKNKVKSFFFKRIIKFDDLLFSRPIANSSIMIKRNLIKEISRKYRLTLYAEDYLWLLKVSEKYDIYNIQKNLTFLNISKDSRTANALFKNFSSLIYIYKRIYNFNFLKILKIFLFLFFNNFKKKCFFYFA